MPEQETPAWVITAQREDFAPGPSGAFVAGTVVSFRTREGAMGSVFVPADQYTVSRVRDLVAEKAATMSDVHGLQG
jgi:hypothetical protein